MTNKYFHVFSFINLFAENILEKSLTFYNNIISENYEMKSLGEKSIYGRQQIHISILYVFTSKKPHKCV